MQKMTKKDVIAMILAGAITFGFYLVCVVILYEVVALFGIVM